MNLHSSHRCRSTGFVPAGSQFSNDPTVVAADVRRRIPGTSGTRRSASSPRRLLQGQRAFTLIEMIGVLSILAVLSSFIAPVIMGTIDRAKVTQVISGYNMVRAGSIGYASKFGYLGDAQGKSIDITTATNIAANWDKEVLMKMKYIDTPFTSRISTSAHVELRPTSPLSTAPNGTNSAYNLEGAAGNPNRTAGAKFVLDVTLKDVVLEDARYLNRALDGDTGNLGETEPGTDLRGRVKYQFPTDVSTGEVRVYVTHL